MAVADQVKKIIVEQLGVDEEEVTPDASISLALNTVTGPTPSRSWRLIRLPVTCISSMVLDVC